MLRIDDMKRKLKFGAAVVLVLSSAGIAVSAAPTREKKTNVLVIYTDDHRYTGVHALGGQDLKTPNIDGLAREGIYFRNAYLMGAFSGATMYRRTIRQWEWLSGKQAITLTWWGNGTRTTRPWSGPLRTQGGSREEGSTWRISSGPAIATGTQPAISLWRLTTCLFMMREEKW